MIFPFFIHYFCQHLGSWLDITLCNLKSQPTIPDDKQEYMENVSGKWAEKQERCDDLDLKLLPKTCMQKASYQSVVLVGEGRNFAR